MMRSSGCLLAIAFVTFTAGCGADIGRPAHAGPSNDAVTIGDNGGSCDGGEEAGSTATVVVVPALMSREGATADAAPPGWDASCASACASRGCGGYIADFPTCKCYLSAGWKWWCSSYCDAVALAAGGAMCTAATCP
jgi:hypothetical protein